MEDTRFAVPTGTVVSKGNASSGSSSKDKTDDTTKNVLSDTLKYLKKTVSNPSVSSVGGEWTVIALSRSDENVNEEFFEKYYNNLEAYLKQKDGDADITMMVLTALAKYKDNEKINSAIKRGLTFLSENQRSNGGYASSETTAQVLTALSSLGISYDDKQFVKNGKTLLDALMKYRLSDGSFAHTAKSDLIAKEQCCYALVAMERLKNGKNSLFDMSDTTLQTGNSKEFISGKNPDVKMPAITNQRKTFADIASHQSRNAIESLAERGIINGMTDTSFEPDKTMTRAEFTAITVRALGLCGTGEIAFDDVNSSDWYFEYVDAAHRYSIVNGVSETKFNPSGTITFEEAATMIERAAKLCGIENIHDENSARDILCVYEDYTTISDWAKRSVAFCMEKEIADNSELKLNPQNAVKRGEIAEMLYNMLRLSGVII